MKTIPRQLYFNAFVVSVVLSIASMALLNPLHNFLVEKLRDGSSVQFISCSPFTLLESDIKATISIILIPLFAFAVSLIHISKIDKSKLISDFYRMVVVLLLMYTVAGMIKVALMKSALNFQIAAGIMNQLPEEQIYFYDWGIYAEVLISGLCAIFVWMKRG